MRDAIFDPYIVRWRLTPDGEAITTPGAVLLPVLFEDQPAMLKIPAEDEERHGGALLRFWDGDGAVRVLAQQGDALVMERATGLLSLVEMARTGRDDEASRIICAVATRLHAPRLNRPDNLVPLRDWFAELAHAATIHGGILATAHATAETLLANQREVVPLHGDLHHMNVLDFGERGWCAIDPKHVIGDRGYDFANIFCNPDHAFATQPGRLAQQAQIVAEAADIDRERLLRWILAYAGLSAAWFISDNDDEAAGPLAVAEIAANEISQPD